MDKFPTINQNGKRKGQQPIPSSGSSQSRPIHPQQLLAKQVVEPPLIVDGNMNIMLKIEKLHRRVLELEAENAKLSKHIVQVEKSMETYKGFISKGPNRGTDISIQTDVRGDIEIAALKAADLRIKILEEENLFLVRDKGHHGHQRDKNAASAVETVVRNESGEDMLLLKSKLQSYESMLLAHEAERRGSVIAMKSAIQREKDARMADIGDIKKQLLAFAVELGQTIKTVLQRSGAIIKECVASQQSLVTQLAHSNSNEERLRAQLTESELRREELMGRVAATLPAHNSSRPASALPSRQQTACLVDLESAHIGLVTAVKQNAHVQDLIRVAGLREATIGRDRVAIDLKHAREVQSLLLFSLETAEKSLAETAPQTVAKLRDGRTKRLRQLEAEVTNKKKDLEQRSVDTCAVSATHLEAFQVKAERKLADAEASYAAAMVELKAQLLQNL